MPALLAVLAALVSAATPATRPSQGADARGTSVSSQPCASEIRWENLPNTDTVFPARHYASLEEWQARREWLRGQIRCAAGLWPEPPRCPLHARIFDRTECDGYSMERVYFESYPGFYVTGTLFRPLGKHGKVPAVAETHGHFKDGRLHQDDTIADIPARCITVARLGMVVFAYDMIGYNDSQRQIDHRINTPQRDLWGISSLHLQTWNSIRVLDFLASLPDVDPKRMAITGESGGGTQTFMLAAIDDRLAAAVHVNMVSHLMQGGCMCENAPGLRIETCNMEFAAMFAPRPLLMISATGDWTKDTPRVEFPFVRGIYALFGAADRVSNLHVDAPHNYNSTSRQAMYRFMTRTLLCQTDEEKIREHDIPRFSPSDLLVWSDVSAPRLLTVEQLTAKLQEDARRQIEALAPTTPEKYAALCEVVRFGLEHALASPLPASVRSEDQNVTPASRPACAAAGNCEVQIARGRFYGEESLNQPGALRVLRRDVTCARNGRRVCGTEVWPPLAETGMVGATLNVVVDARGRAGIDRNPQLAGALAGGRDLTDLHVPLFIEPFGVGANVVPERLKSPRGSTKYFTTFNRTDAAETAYDILTVLGAALEEHQAVLVGSAGRVNLLAGGRLGPIALLARALVPDELARKSRMRTVIDLNGFNVDSDEAYVKELFVPGVRRIGGLRAIAAAACNGPIWFHNVGASFDPEWVEAAGRATGAEVRVSRERVADAELARWLMH